MFISINKRRRPLPALCNPGWDKGVFMVVSAWDIEFIFVTSIMFHMNNCKPLVPLSVSAVCFWKKASAGRNLWLCSSLVGWFATSARQKVAPWYLAKTDAQLSFVHSHFLTCLPCHQAKITAWLPLLPVPTGFSYLPWLDRLNPVKDKWEALLTLFWLCLDLECLKVQAG